MSNTYLVYVILHVLLLLVFWRFGKLMSKSNADRDYWRNAIVPILCFIIVSGLRFGRDIDYNVYYINYTQGFSKDSEIGINFIFDIMHAFNISYYVFPIFCSSLLIFSFVLLLSVYREGAQYALILLMGVMGIELFLRWYLALSIVLIGVFFLYKGKPQLGISLILLSLTIHLGIIIVISLLFITYIIGTRWTISPLTFILLYIFFTFASSTKYLIEIADAFNKFVTLINYQGIGSGYGDSLAIYASGDAVTGIVEKGLTTKLRTIVGYSIIVYFGWQSFVKKNKYKFLYSLMCLSIIVSPLFMMVEIFNRISSALNLLSIYVVSIVFYEIKRKSSYSKQVEILYYIALLFVLYPIGKAPFEVTDELTQMLYLWDAAGREYIPTEYFL